MTFRTEWVHEPHILKTSYEDLVSISEVDMTMLEYLGAVQTQPIYALLDFSKAETIPSALLRLSSISQVINHGNTRWLAIVNPRGGFDVYTTRLLVRDKVKMFDASDKAIAFLKGMVRLDTGEVLKD